MAAITESDKMNFRTQIVDGKPRIFFDPIDNSSTKTRSKRNSRAVNGINRQFEQKSKMNSDKHPTQYDTKRQPTDKKRVNEDSSGLGVYMTMDEIADLVNAVKENTKSESTTTTDTKALSPPRQRNEQTAAPVVPNLDLVLEPPPLPASQVSPRDEALGKMADKKRQKWLREKAEIERMQLEIEYDQLKHQLSPRHKKNPTSPQRSTFQYDFPPPTNKVPLTSAPNKPAGHKPLPVPLLPQALKQNGHQYETSTRNNEDLNQDPYKTRLMEKKQQQWNQENSEKAPLWDPFGRPGAGAPKTHENQPRPSQPPPNAPVSYHSSISQPQPYDNSSSSILPSDRARVPAAMRTNIAFGSSRRQDDVDTLKELERRQWLDDLHKQIDENKRKKYAVQDTERRQDFLRENVHPLVQEAANRHQQPAEMSTNNHNGHDSNKYNQHQTYADAKSTGAPSNQRSGENIFGPTYDSSSKQNTNNTIDPSHLQVGADRQQPYRHIDARRDEAVNTVDATFRSDHGIQTDIRMPPNRRAAPYAYEDSDLPPQVPNHHHQKSNRNQAGKKTVRMHSLDDDQLPRHASTTNQHSHSNGHHADPGPVDIQQRPLWNYNQHKRVEYVPNSKRDPHYEKRQRLKHLELGNFDRVDDVQKKTCYNRWNSDSEIQHQQKNQGQMNRTRTTIPKTTAYGNNKDESIMNLLKGQRKQPEAYGTRYPPSNHTRTEDDYPSNHPSTLDRYENYAAYTRSEEATDPGTVYSQPIETTSHQQQPETNYQSRERDNTNRPYPTAQPTQYSAPTTKQEHILQQLSNIKENLIRRQRELAPSENGVPV